MSTRHPFIPASRPWLAYAQLVRLPNIFTAFADVCLGALATGALPERWLPFGLLLLSSGCLYAAGIVWNDLADQEQDRKERPFRPLPSGRVTRGTAVGLGIGLMVGGVGLALLSGWRGEGFQVRSAFMAILLVVTILLYDLWLKPTWAGPIAMGSCRFLNVMLGLSVAEPSQWPWGLHLASVVGLYIVGVTWFARTEARQSSQTALTAAASVMIASLMLALLLPARLAAGSSSPLFPYLLVGLGFLVGIPVSRAIAIPTPGRVQAAVKRAIVCLVVLDAVLATALAGLVGLAILILLVPVLYLGRWVYST